MQKEALVQLKWLHAAQLHCLHLSLLLPQSTFGICLSTPTQALQHICVSTWKVLPEGAPQETCKEWRLQEKKEASR